MPFSSNSQRRYFHAAESRGDLPKGTAAKWEAHTPKGKKLPEKVGKRRKKAAAFDLDAHLSRFELPDMPALLADLAAEKSAGKHDNVNWLPGPLSSEPPLPRAAPAAPAAPAVKKTPPPVDAGSLSRDEYGLNEPKPLWPKKPGNDIKFTHTPSVSDDLFKPVVPPPVPIQRPTPPPVEAPPPGYIARRRPEPPPPIPASAFAEAGSVGAGEGAADAAPKAEPSKPFDINTLASRLGGMAGLQGDAARYGGYAGMAGVAGLGAYGLHRAFSHNDEDEEERRMRKYSAEIGTPTGLGDPLRDKGTPKTPVLPQQTGTPTQGSQGMPQQRPQGNAGWKPGVSPSANIAAELGNQAYQLRDKIASHRHAVVGDWSGQAALNSLDGYTKFMRPMRKAADDMAMGGGGAPSMDPSMGMGMGQGMPGMPPEMGAPPAQQLEPPMTPGAGGPTSHGFGGGGMEPPQPPEGDALTMGAGAQPAMGGGMGGMDAAPPASIPQPDMGGGMGGMGGGMEAMPKLASLLDRVRWVRTKVADVGQSSPSSMTPNVVPPATRPMNTVPGAQPLQPPAPPPPSGPSMQQMAQTGGGMGAPGIQHGPPHQESKGVYAPKSELGKKAAHTQPSPLGAEGGALDAVPAGALTAGLGVGGGVAGGLYGSMYGAGYGTVFGPDGRKLEATGKGGLRGAAIGAGAGLGAGVGAGIGLSNNSPTGALVGSGLGALAGGVGGHLLGKAVLPAVPTDWDDAIEKLRHERGGRKEKQGQAPVTTTLAALAARTRR